MNKLERGDKMERQGKNKKSVRLRSTIGPEKKRSTSSCCVRLQVRRPYGKKRWTCTMLVLVSVLNNAEIRRDDH